MIDYGTGEDLYWDPVHDEVRFTVPYGDKVLLFRVAQKALAKHFDTHTPAESVGAARQSFAHITHRISEKLALGLAEPDGSILIRDKDW